MFNQSTSPFRFDLVLNQIYRDLFPVEVLNDNQRSAQAQITSYKARQAPIKPRFIPYGTHSPSSPLPEVWQAPKPVLDNYLPIGSSETGKATKHKISRNTGKVHTARDIQTYNQLVNIQQFDAFNGAVKGATAQYGKLPIPQQIAVIDAVYHRLLAEWQSIGDTSDEQAPKRVKELLKRIHKLAEWKGFLHSDLLKDRQAEYEETRDTIKAARKARFNRVVQPLTAGNLTYRSGVEYVYGIETYDEGRSSSPFVDAIPTVYPDIIEGKVKPLETYLPSLKAIDFKRGYIKPYAAPYLPQPYTGGSAKMKQAPRLADGQYFIGQALVTDF